MANPGDVLTFYRKKATTRKAKVNLDVDIDDFIPGNPEDTMVESLVNDMLQMTKLDFLPENEFADIVTGYVQNPEKDAIPTYVEDTITYVRNQMTTSLPMDLDNDVKLKQDMLDAKEQRVAEYASKFASKTIIPGIPKPKDDVNFDLMESKHLEDVRTFDLNVV